MQPNKKQTNKQKKIGDKFTVKMEKKEEFTTDNDKSKLKPEYCIGFYLSLDEKIGNAIKIPNVTIKPNQESWEYSYANNILKHIEQNSNNKIKIGKTHTLMFQNENAMIINNAQSLQNMIEFIECCNINKDNCNIEIKVLP